MPESGHNKFMQRCLDLALKAEGLTYPNPMVGSVLVNGDKIIGEGYHIKAGTPHAEVNAINSVRDKAKLKSSTLYVNLEPCSHFGKTPPCTDLIIACGIPRVIIGTIDTSDKVSGQGVKKLLEAGVDVKTGYLESGCRWINRRFFMFHEKRRPYIILKWAQSADGFLDILRSENHRQEPNWITGKPERILVHKWRASEETILVGAGTVRSDNPRLDVREWTGSSPIKLILSSSGKNLNSSVIKNTGNRVIIFTHNRDMDITDSEKVVLEPDTPAAVQIAQYLIMRGISSLFIEGGAEVLKHFISEGMWDEARIFTGEVFFGNGVKSPATAGQLYSKTVFSGSILEIYVNGSGRESQIDN